MGPCVGWIGGCIGYTRLFRYQHVGIPNAKPSHWGWNIGYTITLDSSIKEFITFNINVDGFARSFGG